MQKEQQEQLIHLETILTMGKYHYSYCIMSMLIARVFTILDSQHRIIKVHFFQALRANKLRRLSRPLCELVRFRLGQLVKITKMCANKNCASAFAMIFEKSRFDSQKVKQVKEKAVKRKRTEAENIAMKSKLTRLMEQLSYLATNIQQTFDDDVSQH